MVDSMTVGADSNEPCWLPPTCVLCPFRNNEHFLSTPLRCILEVAFFAELTSTAWQSTLFRSRAVSASDTDVRGSEGHSPMAWMFSQSLRIF